MASKMAKFVSGTKKVIDRVTIPFGRVTSGTSTEVNVQNTVSGEMRGMKSITPYGISSCPISGLFAQCIINDSENSTFIGINNPGAPKAEPGEVILYSSGGAYIKLCANGNIVIKGNRVDFE